MIEANYKPMPTFTFNVFNNDQFKVEVVSEFANEKNTTYGNSFLGWHWSVVAYIYENHPIFNDSKSILNLPFHGGIVFDAHIHHTPINGVRYNWEIPSEYIKIVGNYNHLGDEEYLDIEPHLGIPFKIRYHAHRIINEILNYKGN